jgi:hypothetical protein
MDSLPTEFGATAKAPIMQAAMNAFLENGDALNRGDLEFMGDYYGEMRDSYTTCTKIGKTTTCTTHYKSPPSYVHSRVITGELIAEISGVTTNGQQPWLSADTVTAMLSDTSLTELHSEAAAEKQADIESRIDRYNTQDHTTEEALEAEYTLDRNSSQRYHAEAEATPRPLPQRYDRNGL